MQYAVKKPSDDWWDGTNFVTGGLDGATLYVSRGEAFTEIREIYHDFYVANGTVNAAEVIGVAKIEMIQREEVVEP
jgi:hypothetical protein